MKSFCRLLLFFALSVNAYATDDSETPLGSCLDLVHVDGTTKNLCEKGDKPFLLLEFFSTRCQYCRRNVPFFQSLERDAGAFAYSRLISLNTQEEALRFSREYSLVTDIAVDTTRAAARSFNVEHVPTLFVLNANNQVVFSHVGILDGATIQRIVNIVRGTNSDTSDDNDGSDENNPTGLKPPKE